jgi:hypothetical protein
MKTLTNEENRVSKEPCQVDGNLPDVDVRDDFPTMDDLRKDGPASPAATQVPRYACDFVIDWWMADAD